MYILAGAGARAVRVNGPAEFRGSIVGGSVAVTGTVGLSQAAG